MIYISKTQLKQVEYLIGQSIQGNHVLFDLEVVRRVFWNEPPFQTSHFTDADGYSVEHHIERMIMQPTLAAKRAYLEGLEENVYHAVVRTYFNIVESNLHESNQVSH